MDRFDVVVIGSGAFGASAAFHLAKLGRNVALIDKADIASQTSANAAGLSGQLRQTEVMTRLAVRAVEKIERFTAETGQPLEFHQPGSLSVARRPEHAQRLQDRVALGRRLGLDIDFIEPAEARELNPFLETEGVVAVTHSRRDVYLEPVLIPRGYGNAAKGLGATLLPNTRVEGIVVDRGAVARVITTGGELRTEAVVDAAGGWVRSVASLAGADLPAVPMRHQLMITVPLPGVSNAQPATRIIDANVYVRPCKGGLMLGGYERDPRPCDLDALPRDFTIEQVELDLRVLRRLARSVEAQFPVFKDVEIQEHRGGLPTMTPDGNYLFGEHPAVAGLYIMGGCNVGGLAISPALGEQMAELIVQGRTSFDLSHLSPRRYAARLPEAELLEAARWQYMSMYAAPAESASRCR